MTWYRDGDALVRRGAVDAAAIQESNHLVEVFARSDPQARDFVADELGWQVSRGRIARWTLERFSKWCNSTGARYRNEPRAAAQKVCVALFGRVVERMRDEDDNRLILEANREWRVFPMLPASLRGVPGMTDAARDPDAVVEESRQRWRAAVLAAMRRYAERHDTRNVALATLLTEERPAILEDTSSRGPTLDQRLPKVLGQLQDEGLLVRLEDGGTVFLVDEGVRVDDESDVEALSGRVVDYLRQYEKAIIAPVATGTRLAAVRQRVGQALVRKQALYRYGGRCAVCDVDVEDLLVASHIDRWGDNEQARGDPANVTCLCVIHDALFERGYWFLDDEYRVCRRAPDSVSVTLKWVLEDLTGTFRTPAHGTPRGEYLRRHRERTGNG